MNGKGFRKGRNSVSNADPKKGRKSRRSTNYRKNKAAKLRSEFGTITIKNDLRCAMLNVNDLNEATLAGVKNTLSHKKVDICMLLETKRRLEENGISIDID